MSIIRKIILYLKHRKEINHMYGYALNEGWVGDWDATWQERLDYWLRAE